MAGPAVGINGRIERAWELGVNLEKWLAAIHERLSNVEQLTRESSAREEYHRFVGKLTTDAAGAGELRLPGIQGYHYQLINIAVTSFTGEAGAALTYMNAAHPSNLLHVTALGQYASDAYPEGTFIPQGVELAISTIGATVNQTLTICILAKKLPTNDPLITVGGGEAS